MRFLLIAVLLSGCSYARDAMREADEKAFQFYTQRCEKIGYQKDTDGMRDCVSRFAALDEILI